MGRAIADLINALAALVPLRTLVVVAVVLAVLALPWWLESVRDRQLRGLVRRTVRADEVRRAELFARILHMAGERPNRLATVADAATKYDQRELFEQAVARLAATGKAAEDVKRLRERIEKPPTRFRDALEATVRVEGLLEAGLVVAAREQLDEALQAFPDDPELGRLRERLEARSS